MFPLSLSNVCSFRFLSCYFLTYPLSCIRSRFEISSRETVTTCIIEVCSNIAFSIFASSIVLRKDSGTSLKFSQVTALLCDFLTSLLQVCFLTPIVATEIHSSEALSLRLCLYKCQPCFVSFQMKYEFTLQCSSVIQIYSLNSNSLGNAN